MLILSILSRLKKQPVIRVKRKQPYYYISERRRNTAGSLEYTKITLFLHIYINVEDKNVVDVYENGFL